MKNEKSFLVHQALVMQKKFSFPMQTKECNFFFEFLMNEAHDALITLKNKENTIFEHCECRDL